MQEPETKVSPGSTGSQSIIGRARVVQRRHFGACLRVGVDGALVVEREAAAEVEVSDLCVFLDFMADGFLNVDLHLRGLMEHAMARR